MFTVVLLQASIPDVLGEAGKAIGKVVQVPIDMFSRL